MTVRLIPHRWVGTWAQYNAIAEKDQNTEYWITDATFLKLQYSVGGETWSDTWLPGTTHIRLSIDNGANWSGAIYVKGADGEGTGDVVGPASAVGSNFAAFNGVTGKLIKDSGVKPSDFAEAVHTHGYLANVSEDTTPELGGALDCNNALVYWDLYSISGTTIDVANGNKQKLTLSDTNLTVTLETPSGACAFHLVYLSGSTPRTITWPTIKWLGGTAP